MESVLFRTYLFKWSSEFFGRVLRGGPVSTLKTMFGCDTGTYAVRGN